MLVPQPVELLKKVAATASTLGVLIRSSTAGSFTSPGLDAGGRIVLVSGTTQDVEVTDAAGNILFSDTVIASVSVDPTARGLLGPLYYNIGAGDGVITIYWWVRR